MADLSTSFNPGLVATNSDAASNAASKATVALSDASDVSSALAAQKLNSHVAPDGAVAFNKQQATNFVIHNSTADPSSPATGQIWLRTDL